jgi:hypothetical protein
VNLEHLDDRELIALWADVMAELNRRELTRSANNPVADYAERIVAERFGLTLAGQSAPGYDATDEAGVRYQIKARRHTRTRPSRQLGAIRNLDHHEFDFLIAVFFDRTMNLAEMWKLPHDAVARHATYVPHTNSYRLVMNAEVLADSTVERLV